MKKIYSFLMLAIVFATNAQSGTIAIGSDNLTSPLMPVFSFYGYTYSQQIVTKQRFNTAGGTAGEITKLRYYCVSTGSAITPWNNWDIYIGHTNKTTFQGGDWVPVTQMTQVFSGEFNPVAGTWIEFEFSEPFEYNDIDNIVIAVDENAPGWTAASNAAVFYSYFEGANRGMRIISDSTNFDPENPVGNDGLFSQLPMLQFEGQILGVDEQSKKTVSVYPNPSSGIFNISSEGQITLAEVFDVSGRKVASERLENQSAIDLRKLQPAQYFLRIHTQDGVFTTKIVKR